MKTDGEKVKPLVLAIPSLTGGLTTSIFLANSKTFGLESNLLSFSRSKSHLIIMLLSLLELVPLANPLKIFVIKVIVQQRNFAYNTWTVKIISAA